MAGQGDIDVRIVENPTAATVTTACEAAITATSASAAINPVFLGQHLMLITVEGA